MSFFKKIGKFVGKVAPAAIGFGLAGPLGGLAGAALGRGMRGFGGGGGGGGGQAPIGPDPSQAAMPYLDQIPAIGRQYYEPFIGEGRAAADIANPVYNRMTQDPTEFINSIMRSYNPSEGYRFKERALTRAAQNSAAQGGFAGTPTSQLEQADLVRGLLGEDMQQYLGNVLGAQQRGLQGQEGRIGRGFVGSSELADYLGSALGQQAGLGFQGQSQQNANRLDAFNNARADKTARRNAFLNFLGKGIGTAGSMMGGGFGG